jgi:hypothetical protein
MLSDVMLSDVMLSVVMLSVMPLPAPSESPWQHFFPPGGLFVRSDSVSSVDSNCSGVAFLKLSNGPSKLECYITATRKSLSGMNTLAYWAHS